MNKNSLKIHNLKLYRSITGFTASFVLATSLSGVPVYADTNNIIKPIVIENTTDNVASEKEVTTGENVTFSGTYDNLNDAENVKNEKEEEYRKKGYQNIKSKIVKYDIQEKTDNVIEKYVDSNVSFEKGAYVFDNLDDAYSKKEELESSINPHDGKIEVTINKNSVDSGQRENIDVDEFFSSREDVELYLQSLEEQGYEINDPTITRTVSNSEVYLDQTFGTYDEAEQALNDFQNEYDDIITDGIVENKTDTVIETITDNVPYESEDLAWEALNDFLNNPENETRDYYFTGDVVEATDNSITDVTQINERFDSEEEALEYISELEEEGYTVTNYSFLNDKSEQLEGFEKAYSSFEEAQAALDEFEVNHPNADMVSMETIEAGTVYGSEPIVYDMKLYRTAQTPYAIIKDNNDVYVWTEEKLSEDEQKQFKDTYGNVISDQILPWDVIASDDTKFIDGYEKFQSFDGKEFSFELDEEKNIQINIDLNDVTYIGRGFYEPKSQYILEFPESDSIELESGTLVGEKSKEISTSIYFTNIYKMAKTYSVFAQGYETVYEDSYRLTANCFKKVMIGQYSLDVTTEVKNYSYYNEMIDGNCYDLTVTADIVHELNKEQLKSPQTGDENNMAVPFAGLATSSAILAGYALTKKRKRY